MDRKTLIGLIKKLPYLIHFFQNVEQMRSKIAQLRKKRRLAKTVNYLNRVPSNNYKKTNWKNRIPEQLIEKAMRGEYLRTIPYPIDKMIESLQKTAFVTKNLKIVTIGSCFAQELNKWLVQNGYCCLPHEYGVVYTPQSMMQLVKYSFRTSGWNPVEKFWIRQEKYYDPYRKSADHSGPMYIGQTEDEALLTLQEHYKQSASLFTQAELIVFIVKSIMFSKKILFFSGPCHSNMLKIGYGTIPYFKTKKSIRKSTQEGA